jgi:hypothetical protein
MFIKFSNKEFIEPLQKEGLIYMNSFDFFKQCENKEQLDPDENITQLLQGDKCEICFEGYTSNGENGLVDVKINAPFLSSQEFTHLFCMWHIGQNEEIKEDCKIFDEKMKDFGDTMLVIYNPKSFMDKLKKALDKAVNSNEIIYAETKKVDYVDFSTYHGEIEAFRKKIQYKHQSEWRLALQREDYKSPYVLKVGSIEDCSVVIPVNKCKNRITLKDDGTHNIEL